MRLNGWFISASAPGHRAAPLISASATDQGDPVVVVFNGNAGDRSFRAPLAALSVAGLSVLLLHYRGYGGNPGTPSEQGLLADGRAARAYVASRTDVDHKRIV